jgi:hypothetical protein
MYGIKSIALARKGSLLGGSPTNLLVLGSRKAGSMQVTNFNEVKDANDRFHQGKVNFKTESEFLQSTIRNLGAMVELGQYGAEAQIVIEGERSASNPERFNFAGDVYPGYDFEFMITPTERLGKVILESAHDYSAANSIISNASTNAEILSGGVSVYGATKNWGFNSGNLYNAKDIVVAYGGSELFSADEIKNFNIVIKSVSTKKETDNRSMVNYVNFLVEVTAVNASLTKINTIKAINRYSPLTITQENPFGNSDQFVFGENAVSRKDEVIFGDEERTVKLIWEGKVPCKLSNITFSDQDADGNTDKVEFKL